MEQKLVRITKLAPPPWYVAIAPILMAAGLIFPPIGLVLVYQNDALVDVQKRDGLERDRLTAENLTLQARLLQLEGPSTVLMQLPQWPGLMVRDRSSACHACSGPLALDRRLDAMTFLPTISSDYLLFGTSASWHLLRPFAHPNPFLPAGR